MSFWRRTHHDLLRTPPRLQSPTSASEAPLPTKRRHTAPGSLPTSFGVFKPVGHLMVVLPTQAQAGALTAALRDQGSPDAAVQQFSPRDSAAELRAMVDQAGSLAGFGYEITLLRRYLVLDEAGYRWLLVKVSTTSTPRPLQRLPGPAARRSRSTTGRSRWKT
jgi:hypothetical protein